VYKYQNINAKIATLQVTDGDNMALMSNSNAPYAPAATVVNLLKRFRDKGLAIPVTAEVLIRAGVAESLVQRTLQALQLLELISEDGQATEVLKKIRAVPEKEYKATLAAWIKQVYAEVFAFADPATEDETEVRDAFRTYLPHAQQDRMVKLFMALCAEAGLAPESKKAEAKPRIRSSPSTTTPKPNARRTTPTPGTQDVLRPGTLPPELAGLMARLPQSGWTKPTRDKFLKTFESVLDYVIPVLTNEPPVDEGGAP
jgi:hypothetical protein